MKACIKGISFYLPVKTLTNEDLIFEFPEWSVNKITEKLGIENRHIASENETAVDLAVNAALKLFQEFEIDKSKVDYVILCTQSPDYLLPTSACIVHNQIGLPLTAGAIDINQGCAGFIYGLSLAKGLVVSGICQNVLLITSETYSKYLDIKDKSNRSIFGDAATASLISQEGTLEIGDFIFGTDGSGAENLIVKNGGARFPRTLSATYNIEENNKDNFLFMNGANIFNFTLKFLPLLVNQVLSKNYLKKENVDYYVFHQANKFLLDTVRKVCGIEVSSFHNNMVKTGNTVSSTIPIVLKDKYFADDLNTHKNILLAGFGVGYSWAGCTLKKK
jgi:3-oxoacyl-[acyl-carrier-protein] synthase-3